MDITNKKMLSVLQTYDVQTGERKVLKKFDEHIEAPNWSADGAYLVYNSQGHIFRYDLGTGESTLIPTGVCTRCNNDHVLSKDGKWMAISAGTDEDGWSKVWTVPMQGGEPKQITPLKPSYLHGISPDDHRRGPGRRPRVQPLRQLYLVQLRAQRPDAGLAHECRRHLPNPDDL